MLVLSRQINERTVIVVPPSDTETVIETMPVRLSYDKVRTVYIAPDTIQRLKGAKAA